MNLFRILSLVLMMSWLTGCGGGGGATTIREVLGLATLSGTAAGGAAIVGTVQVTDSSTPPNTKGVLIDADGKYTIDVSGMTSPFVLKAHGTVGNTTVTYYSAAVLADVGNTVNVTPFTDIMISNISAQMAQNCFADMAHPCISLKDKLTPENLVKAQADLQAKLLPVLRNLGLSESIDFLRASFATDHTGMDAVLDMVKIEGDPVTNTAVLRNGITGDEIGRMDPKTEVGRRDPVDSSKLTGISKDTITDAQAIQYAIEGIAKLFANSLPTPQQLENSGLFDVGNFLNDGIRFGQFAMEISTQQQMIGLKFKNIHIEFDADDKTIARVFFKMYDKSEKYHEDAEFVVYKQNGKWQTKGNQLIANIDIHAHAEFSQNLGSFFSGISFWLDAFDYNSLVADGDKAVKAIISGPGLQLPNGTAQNLELSQATYDSYFQNSFVSECLSDSYAQQVCLDFRKIKVNDEYTVVFQNAQGLPVNLKGYKIKLKAVPIATYKLTPNQFVRVDKVLIDGKLNALINFKPGKSLTVIYTNSPLNMTRGIFLNAWSTVATTMYVRLEQKVLDPTSTNMLFAWDTSIAPFDVINMNINPHAKDEEGREFQTNFWLSNLTDPSDPVDPTLARYEVGPDNLPEGFYIRPSQVPTGWWSADDDVTMYLNGSIIFQDKNIATDAFPPVVFWAKPGDTLRIVATDTAGTCHYLTPLKITNGQASTPLTGTSVPQVCDYLPPSSTPFF
jgi:hypothetical protein